MPPRTQRFLALTLLLAATVAVYWAGLHGPFLLDDTANLQPVKDWLYGKRSLSELVFGNRSGPIGRPVSMASFVASAATTGYSPFSFKLGNLLLHLMSGTLVYALFAAIARRDANLKNHPWLAIVMTSAWLLHPLMVSTVLYAVQRMAMLSTVFTIAAILCWWHGRVALENGAIRRGWLMLFGALPVLTVLAILSKENGVLAPLLCWVLEAVYFTPKHGQRRPLGARIFVWLGCVLPLFLGLVALIHRPSRLFGGYANREFSLMERLLTEARVLFDYVGSILVPWGPRLSLFRDDYLISTGLLTPSTTLIAILGWSIAVLLAWRLRRAIPAFSAGIGLFLIGHSLESSFVPLLIYFEHRNYLPSIGIILAAVGTLTWIAQRLKTHMHRPRLVFSCGTIAILITLTAATHARVLVWQDKEAILASSLKYHPESRWLRMEIAQFAMERRPADEGLARTQYAALRAVDNPVDREIGILGLAAIDCYVHAEIGGEKVDELLNEHIVVMEPDLLKALTNLAELIMTRPCRGLPAGDLADRLVAWLDRSPVAEARPTKWHARFIAARLYLAQDGNTSSRALEQARIAWKTGQADPPVGAMIVALSINRHDYSFADSLLTQLEEKVPKRDLKGQALLQDYRRKLNTITSRPANMQSIDAGTRGREER